MGVWQRLFRSKRLGKLRLSGEEWFTVQACRKAGMSDRMIEMSIQGERSLEEARRAEARGNASTAPTHGSPRGTEFTCASDQCGRRMRKVGAGRGGLALTVDEIAQGVGPAEECRECGRAYCGNCYPNRTPKCACGINQDVVRVEDGVTYRGSLVLVKVQYIDQQQRG